MARSWLVRPRTLGAGLALWSLALVVACHSNTTPAPKVTPTPTPISSGATSSPVPNSYAALVPDGGNGFFHGIQVVHYELFDGTLLASPQPLSVNFSGSVGAIGLASDSTDMLAALGSGSPFTSPLVQDVYGSSTANLVPSGTAYNASVVPSPIPSTCPSIAPLQPTLSDVTSLAIVGSTSSATGLAVGPSNAGILGLTSLTNGPPQFACFIPYNGQPVNPPANPRANIQVGAIGTGTTTTTGLVRGPSDLVAYSVTVTQSGNFQLLVKAFDTTLGSGVLLRGRGGFALDPHDSGKAIVTTPVAGATNVTLLTGLPTAMTHSASLSLPSTPRSVAITSNGEYAVVGADSGFYVLAGITSDTLSVNAAYAPGPSSQGANSPTYIGCNGQTFNAQNITSVAQSTDAKYLILLVTQPGAACANGYNSSILVVPFNPSTGIPPTPAPSPTATATASASPVPTSFTQNNIVTPPTNADYMGSV